MSGKSEFVQFVQFVVKQSGKGFRYAFLLFVT